MKKRTRKMEQKIKKLRKKYAEGYVSDYYMRTGIPQHTRDKLDEADKFIEQLDKQNKKNTEKAIKEAKKAVRKRKKKIDDKAVFI